MVKLIDNNALENKDRKGEKEMNFDEKAIEIARNTAPWFSANYIRNEIMTSNELRAEIGFRPYGASESDEDANHDRARRDY